MAGETINITSAAWHTIQAASSTTDGSLCAGARTAINATSLSADEELYPLLDMRLTISVGTPTVNTTVDVYRRSKGDGTNESPAPVATDFTQQYVGSFVLDNTAATSYYYLQGVVNSDPEATYYMINNSGATLTIALACQSRGWTTA